MKKKFNFNFRLVLASQIISLFGGSMLQVALMLFLADFTSNEFYSIAIAISFTPLIIFTPLGGVIADRFHKKASIILLDLAKAMVCFLMFVVFITDSVTLVNLTVLLFIAMTIMALFAPVLTAAIPVLVHKNHLVEANGAIQTINGSAFVVGSILAAILTPLIGTANIILGCGFLFSISVVIDRFIRVPFVRRQTKANFSQMMVGDMKESWHYLKRENPKILKLSFLFATLAALFQPAVVQVAPIVTDLLDGTEFLVAVANAVIGLGAVVGAMLVGKLKKWLHLGSLSEMMLLSGIGGILLALALHPATLNTGFQIPFWTFSISLAIVIAIQTLASVTVGVVMQKETPSELLGKVSALFRMIGSIANPIGILLFGMAVSLANGQFDLAFIAVAIATLALAVVTKMMFGSSSSEEI